MSQLLSVTILPKPFCIPLGNQLVWTEWKLIVSTDFKDYVHNRFPQKHLPLRIKWNLKEIAGLLYFLCLHCVLSYFLIFYLIIWFSLRITKHLFHVSCESKAKCERQSSCRIEVIQMYLNWLHMLISLEFLLDSGMSHQWTHHCSTVSHNILLCCFCINAENVSLITSSFSQVNTETVLPHSTREICNT